MGAVALAWACDLQKIGGTDWAVLFYAVVRSFQEEADGCPPLLSCDVDEITKMLTIDRLGRQNSINECYQIL